MSIFILSPGKPFPLTFSTWSVDTEKTHQYPAQKTRVSSAGALPAGVTLSFAHRQSHAFSGKEMPNKDVVVSVSVVRTALTRAGHLCLCQPCWGASAEGNTQVRVGDPQCYPRIFPVCSSVSLSQYVLPSILLVEHSRKPWISFQSTNSLCGLNHEHP